MIEPAKALFDTWAVIGGLVFLRMGGLMVGLPVFAEQSIPVRIRLAIAVALAFIIAPLTAQPVGGLIPAAGGEVLTGLFFGLVLRLITLALNSAGAIIGNTTSLAQLFGASASVEPQPVIGRFLFWGALALLALSDLPVRIVSFALLTYDLVPTGALPDASVVAQNGVEAVARSFAIAFSLAAPFVVASFLYNLFLGVVSRAMPQLMVTLIGAPALTGGSILLLLVCAPVLIDVWINVIHSVLDTGGVQ